MRYSKTHKAETRRRILDEAKRLFREQGAESIGIGELMTSLGLTHGGFYAHFKSKEALVAEACFEIFLDTASHIAAEEPSLLAYYLHPGHRDDPAHGCAMPTMAAEVSRSSDEVRQAFTHGLKAWMEKLAPMLPPGRGHVYENGPALAMVASMVGAVMLSRAVNDANLSGRILRETEAFLSRTVSTAAQPARDP